MGEDNRMMTIRVPVLVTDDGRWSANGWSPRDGEDRCDPDWFMMEEIVGDMPGGHYRGHRKVWVTAEVPLPDCADAEVAALSPDTTEEGQDNDQE